MKVVVSTRAREEILVACAWYEAKLPQLGEDFATAVDVAIRSALQRPLSFALVSAGHRRVLLKRFPYSVVFRLRPDEIFIAAVFHHHRNPVSGV